jgi:hypothetical protein
VQGGNPYATITEQRERINNLIRALNNVNLHLSTSVSVSQYVSSVLLADGGDDGDDDDDNNNDDIRDPLLTSSMRRASFKCETPRLKLKSS